MRRCVAFTASVLSRVPLGPRPRPLGLRTPFIPSQAASSCQSIILRSYTAPAEPSGATETEEVPKSAAELQREQEQKDELDFMLSAS